MNNENQIPIYFTIMLVFGLGLNPTFSLPGRMCLRHCIFVYNVGRSNSSRFSRKIRCYFSSIYYVYSRALSFILFGILRKCFDLAVHPLLLLITITTVDGGIYHYRCRTLGRRWSSVTEEIVRGGGRSVRFWSDHRSSSVSVSIYISFVVCTPRLCTIRGSSSPTSTRFPYAISGQKHGHSACTSYTSTYTNLRTKILKVRTSALL